MKFHLVLALLLVLASSLFAQREQDPAAMEQDLFRLVNQERAKAGVPALRLDPMLVDAARAHAQVMAQRKTLSHRLEGEPDLSQRIAATRLRFNAVAENVSSAQGSDESTPADVAHGGLMGSPPHRANILNPDYNSIGIGVARAGKTYYTTEDFAKAYAAVDTSDVERIVAGKVNEIRRRHSLPALRAVPLDRLAAIACRDTTNVQTLLQSFSSARTALIFTTWTPENVPARISELAEEPGVSTISLHACSMPPAQGGSGGFKVAAIFF